MGAILRVLIHGAIRAGRGTPVRLAMVVVFVLVLFSACGKGGARGGAKGETILDVSTVTFPEPTTVWGRPSPGPLCAIHAQFHNFFRFNWSEDLELSGFGAKTSNGRWYRVFLDEGRIRSLRDYTPGRGLSGATTTIYRVDQEGRLESVTELIGGWAMEGEEANEDSRGVLRSVQIQYDDRSLPLLLTVKDVERAKGKREYVIKYEFDALGRLESRASFDRKGEPICALRSGLAAQERLHYEGKSLRIVRSDLFDEEGEPITVNGVPVHVEWPEQDVAFNRLVGPDGAPIGGSE